MDIFSKLQRLLIEAIPQTIASLKLTEPICALRIYYFDTHAPLTYLTLRLVSAAEREEILEEEGRDAPFTLWSAGEECGQVTVHLPDTSPRSPAEARICELFAEVYEELCEDEEENMPLFQRMLQRVALALNEGDFRAAPVTDDFVVAPADGSQFFADEDEEELVASIPAARLELLRRRKYLGPAGRWDQLPKDEDAEDK